MRKDVIIHIKGYPKYDDDDGESIDFITEGKFYRKNGSYYIVYKESELTGMEGITTTLKVDGDTISLIRNGMFTSHMMFEKGQRHFGLYNTDGGAMTVAISARSVRSTIGDDGGDLEIDYTIEIDHVLTGENLFRVNVTPPGRITS